MKNSALYIISYVFDMEYILTFDNDLEHEYVKQGIRSNRSLLGQYSINLKSINYHLQITMYDVINSETYLGINRVSHNVFSFFFAQTLHK